MSLLSDIVVVCLRCLLILESTFDQKSSWWTTFPLLSPMFPLLVSQVISKITEEYIYCVCENKNIKVVTECLLLQTFSSHESESPHLENIVILRVSP